MPKIGIVMGSDSDLPAVRHTIEMLDRFGIEYTVNVISAHRTPKAAHTYAVQAEESGTEVLIAAAGGAAHLAGVLASLTSLPVIGIPMESAALSGIDSLYSTVQMPSGVPVATMAIGRAGAKNAAIFAAQILALADPQLRKKVRAFKETLAEEVAGKDERVNKEFQDRADGNG